jgi:hypothetical protein
MKVFITISAICSALFSRPIATFTAQDNLVSIEFMSAESKESNLSDIFHGSFELFQLLRNEKGGSACTVFSLR